MDDRAAPPLSPEPVSGPRDGDLPAYLGNGLIGLRVREVPLFAGMVLVSGLAGAHPERGIEAAAAAPYPLSGDLAIDGVWMSEQPWSVSELRQSYDFSTAELHSAFTYQVGIRTVSVEVVAFASRTAPSIVAQEVRVTADGPCDLKFRAVVSITGLTGRIARRRTETPGESQPACDGSLLWETAEALGQCGLALVTEAPPVARRQVLNWCDAGPLCTEYGIRLTSGSQEAAPGAGDAAHHEDHVSLHVARAFSLFADATGDERFLEEEAWPVLSGVADWFVSRVSRTSRGFELLRSMGPAEVPSPPDNDAFSLMAGADVLRRALRVAERLRKTAPDAWKAVLDDLYLPLRSDGVIAAHDDYDRREEKGATPSPLAGLFPYDYPASPSVSRKTLAFYLKLWPDYVGSPMLPALYCVWAAMAGDRELALKLFEEGFAAYDRPRFHQCLEYRLDHADGPAAGPFFANLGGMLLGLCYGLTGLVVDDGEPDTWARRPITLPAGWEAVRIDRLRVRGRSARLVARQGAERAELSFS